MFFTDSGIWNAISNFARSLGVSEAIVMKAKQDFKELLDQYTETRRLVMKDYESEKLDASLSMQNFHPYWANLFCFFELILSGFRHSALRELRSYLEASERSYYIDSRYNEQSYEDKVKLLKLFKARKTKEDMELLKTILSNKQQNKIREKIKSGELLHGIPVKKQNELEKFYSDLCEYVHLSELAQTDALRDFSLNLALQHPYYEEDKEMLKAVFEYSRYLLLESLR